MEKTEHGLSLVEIVIAVAVVAILATGTLVTYNVSKERSAQQELSAVAATAYTQALDAETSFDENESAETVVAELQEEYPAYSFRHTGSGHEDFCVIVNHADTDEEVITGSCIEQVASNPSPAVTETVTVENLQCFDSSSDNTLHDRQLRLEWEPPTRFADGDEEIVYIVKWLDILTSQQGEMMTHQTTYTHTAPAMHRGYPFTPSTEFLIIPVVDGIEFPETFFYSRDTGHLNNARYCHE